MGAGAGRGESALFLFFVDSQLASPWEARLEVQRGLGTPLSSSLPLQFFRAGLD